MEPLVGLAPTNTSLQNSPCGTEAWEFLIFDWEKVVLSRGLASRTSAFAKRRAENYLHLESKWIFRKLSSIQNQKSKIKNKLASVAGLAPARLRWKDGPLDLLCIHGRELEMAPKVGIAPTSPRLQRGANLSQLLGVLAHSH